MMSRQPSSEQAARPIPAPVPVLIRLLVDPQAFALACRWSARLIPDLPWDGPWEGLLFLLSLGFRLTGLLLIWYLILVYTFIRLPLLLMLIPFAPWVAVRAL